jgi:hypothetical protein
MPRMETIMSPTPTLSPTATSTRPVPQPGPCPCPEELPPQCCCSLVCFDRPNYFCGHLLTDADLTLQQKYVLEKNKLYHRTLDGHGVVCGLKLTCDCDCAGNILIHDGFAIDDCGNDLVVCETTRFDVIAKLKSKSLLILDPTDPECEPRRREPRCDIKQCFYVTICYDETQSQYETPFQSSCTAGPKQCMPTRTHEGVRFDVTDKLPPRYSYLDSLEKRIRECFEINCDSRLGALIKEHAKELLAIFEAKEDKRELAFDPCELFCKLRAYFLNHLKIKPDLYNCNLYEEVACLSCPERCREHEGGRQEGNRWILEGELLQRLQSVFRELLYCMQRYQYDCVFGDLIFECCQPCEAHCLVLGTVEVLNGKLVRVCNTPRHYLWAPANLLQVLTFEILTGQAANAQPELPGGEHHAHCCPTYDRFDPQRFLQEFSVSECGRRFAAESLVESLRAVTRSLHRSFDFTDDMALAPKLFAELLDKSKREVEEGVKALGVEVSLAKTPASHLSTLNPLQALLSHALLRPGDSAVGYRGEEGVRVLPDFVTNLSPDRSAGGALETKLQDHAQEVSDLKAEVADLRRIIHEIEDAQKAGRKRGTPPK